MLCKEVQSVLLVDWRLPFRRNIALYKCLLTVMFHIWEVIYLNLRPQTIWKGILYDFFEFLKAINWTVS
jgi:hypothetical protein